MAATAEATQVLWKDYVEDRAVTPEDFEVVTREIGVEVAEGEALLELLWVSVDPYMRGRMKNVKGYFVGPFEPGKPVSSGALALVKASKSPALKEGDVVSGLLPWSSLQVLGATEAQQVQKLDPSLKGKVPLSYFLGSMGMPGLTAWAGLKNIAEPIDKGEVAFVSAAAGAVGLVAVQLLKHVYGCKVIGSAGSDDKVSLLREVGADVAFNYKTEDTAEVLRREAPDGVNVYFENVGGPTLDAVLDNAALHARIVMCGVISQYDKADQNKYGIRNYFNVVTRRIKMQGFIVSDYFSQQPEFAKAMGELVASGKVRVFEHRTEGLENAGRAFCELMSGANTGKAVVKVCASDPWA